MSYGDVLNVDYEVGDMWGRGIVGYGAEVLWGGG